MRFAIAAASAIILASTSLALACGEERWSVKVGSDQDVSHVAGTVSPSTIAALTNLPRPQNPNHRPNNRFAPTEITPVAISGILVVIKPEDDQDYHLVIVDPGNLDLQNKAHRMIIESPDPSCAAGSRFAAQIAAVRQAIEAHFNGPITRKLHVQMPVRVMGVPFYDPLHGQEGVAQNGIELHPILAIQFGQMQ